MATLKLHYDGWLTLPSGLRQKLDLQSGDRLEVELVDNAIVLRPAKKTRAAAKPEQTSAPAPADSTASPSATIIVPAKRPRGRPRKIRAVDGQPLLVPDLAESPLPAAKRKPGRPRKVRAEEIELLSARAGESGLWKLRPKAELPIVSPDPEPVPPPRRPEPSRTGGSQEREERRPFRNVEVRKLGPGRRHNRLQRARSPTGAG